MQRLLFTFRLDVIFIFFSSFSIYFIRWGTPTAQWLLWLPFFISFFSSIFLYSVITEGWILFFPVVFFFSLSPTINVPPVKTLLIQNEIIPFRLCQWHRVGIVGVNNLPIRTLYFCWRFDIVPKGCNKCLFQLCCSHGNITIRDTVSHSQNNDTKKYGHRANRKQRFW